MREASSRLMLHRRAMLALALCLLTATSACVRPHAAQPQAGRTVVVDHVHILDGQGAPALVDARVVIQDGKIVRIAKSGAALPPGATVVDGAGGYLLPGFIDMHAHLLFPRCDTDSQGAPRFDRALSERVLSRLLDFGITTVRSPATPTIAGLALRDDLNAGRTRGPRALASAELINDSSLTDAQLREAVREALPYKPDYFKVYARLAPEQVSSVVDEARRHGIPVIGHLQQTRWAEGIARGVAHLVHSVDWSLESLPPAARPAYAQALKTRRGFRSRIDWLELFEPDTPAERQLIAELARRRVSVDVTLVAYDGKFSPPGDERYRRNPYLEDFPELRQDWERCSTATSDWSPEDHRRWQAARPKLLDRVKRMSDGGVLLVSGTDLTNAWVIPGEGLHQEFELLAEAGLSPEQILRMTGASAAEALGRDDVGIIEEGRTADLVLLSGDPRRDIRNTRSIVWVMKNGHLVSRGPRGSAAAKGR